jgi:hypothetical protein
MQFRALQCSCTKKVSWGAYSGPRGSRLRARCMTKGLPSVSFSGPSSVHRISTRTRVPRERLMPSMLTLRALRAGRALTEIEPTSDAHCRVSDTTRTAPAVAQQVMVPRGNIAPSSESPDSFLVRLV